MNRIPSAIFVVDIHKEHIAVAEARKLNIPIFAMVDTNSDPGEVDFIIPSNDDASKSIEKIISNVADAIVEGLSERKAGKEKSAEGKKDKAAKPAKAKAKAVANDEEEQYLTI